MKMKISHKAADFNLRQPTQTFTRTNNLQPIVRASGLLIAVVLLHYLQLVACSALKPAYDNNNRNNFEGGNDLRLGPSLIYRLGAERHNSGGDEHLEAARRLAARFISNSNGNNEIELGQGISELGDDAADDDLISWPGSWSPAVKVNSLQSPQSPPPPASQNAEIFLLEDKDYPKSAFEDYPQRVGQVSGITTLPNNDVVILHRSDRQWTAETFNATTGQIPEAKRDDLIKNDTIMVIDREDGGSVNSFGSNLFYMPHSIASDHQGNLWVSDVARHQVMRLPASNIQQQHMQASNNNYNNNSSSSNSTDRRQVWPDIILGEAFVPGNDAAHFCQPTEIAVSSDGRLVYVADGYCNERVMVFSGLTGKLITSFGQQDNLRVVHSLTLIEERNLLCVAGREQGRIICYNAGLELGGDLRHLGELVHEVTYPLGRVFAITSISPNHLLVSSNQVNTNRYDLAILNPFSHELKLVWTSSDLLEPHSLTTTLDRQCAYAADVSKDAYKKVFKFNVIQHIKD